MQAMLICVLFLSHRREHFNYNVPSIEIIVISVSIHSWKLYELRTCIWTVVSSNAFEISDLVDFWLLFKFCWRLKLSAKRNTISLCKNRKLISKSRYTLQTYSTYIDGIPSIQMTINQINLQIYYEIASIFGNVSFGFGGWNYTGNRNHQCSEEETRPNASRSKRK